MTSARHLSNPLSLAKRTGYMAQRCGRGLTDGARCPITPAMKPGDGCQSVTHATRQGTQGQPEPIVHVDTA